MRRKQALAAMETESEEDEWPSKPKVEPKDITCSNDSNEPGKQSHDDKDVPAIFNNALIWTTNYTLIPTNTIFISMHWNHGD